MRESQLGPAEDPLHTSRPEWQAQAKPVQHHTKPSTDVRTILENPQQLHY